MSFDFAHIHIADGSPEGQSIQSIMEKEHVAPEEALLRILRRAATEQDKPTPIEEGLGLLGSPEDSALMEEALELIYAERRRPSARTANI